MWAVIFPLTLHHLLSSHAFIPREIFRDRNRLGLSSLRSSLPNDRAPTLKVTNNTLVQEYSRSVRRLAVHEHPLAERFYKQQSYVAGSSCKRSDIVLVLRQRISASSSGLGNIIAAVRLSPKLMGIGHAEEQNTHDPIFLLRAVCVHVAWRRQGLARRLLCDGVVEFLEGKDGGCCYCFPRKHLEALYVDAGFTLIDADTMKKCPTWLPRFAKEEYRLVKKQRRGDVILAVRDATGDYN